MRAQIDYLRSLRAESTNVLHALSVSVLFLIVAVVAPLLVCERAQAATIESATPYVLIFDRAQIWARYIDPKLSEVDAAPKKVDLIQTMRPLILKLMDQTGATLVLDKTAVLAGAEEAQINPQSMISELDKTHVPLNASMPPPEGTDNPKPVSLRALIINRAGVLKAMTATDEPLSSVLKQLVTDDPAGIVLDGAAVARSAPELDATVDVIDRLNGRNDAIRHRGIQAHVILIDFGRVLHESAVGKSIAAQVRDVTQSSMTEFHETVDTLRKEGEALKVKLPSLIPEEKTREVKAFQAREKILQTAIKTREQNIRDAVSAARASVINALVPIVAAAMESHGAGLLINSEFVVQGPENADITTQAITELDSVMTSTTLTLPPEPAPP